jgi:hypothetical protein
LYYVSYIVIQPVPYPLHRGWSLPLVFINASYDLLIQTPHINHWLLQATTSAAPSNMTTGDWSSSHSAVPNNRPHSLGFVLCKLGVIRLWGSSRCLIALVGRTCPFVGTNAGTTRKSWLSPATLRAQCDRPYILVELTGSPNSFFAYRFESLQHTYVKSRARAQINCHRVNKSLSAQPAEIAMLCTKIHDTNQKRLSWTIFAFFTWSTDYFWSAFVSLELCSSVTSPRWR